MARYLIVGEAGSDSIWVIDTVEKSVKEMDAAGIESGGSALVGTLASARGGDEAFVKGIDVAVAVNARAAAASHHFFVNA